MPFLAREIGGKEGTGDIESRLLLGCAAAEAQDIRVIVLAGHQSAVGILAQGRTDAWRLVRRDAHPDARAADQYAPVEIAVRDGLSDLKADIRVVNRIRGIRAEVLEVYVLLPKKADNCFLERKSRMIRSDRHPHTGDYIIPGSAL